MATLNAEPARPEGRKVQDLPPKSYAAAAVEEPSAPNGSVGYGGDESNRENGMKHSNGTNGTTTNGGVTHMAPVLRIVDTSATKPKEDEDQRPKMERQESKHEYTATGLDDTSRSPPRSYKHRRSSSQKSNMPQEEHKRPKQEDTDGIQTSEAIAAPEKKDAVFKKAKVEHNGTQLVSVHPGRDYEKQLERDRKESRRESLVSGRQAGQRWQTSGIRFAPMNVPLKRRLQTLLVLFHTLVLALSISTFFFLCAIPIFWPFMIPYLIYTLTSKASTSGELSRRSEFFRSMPIWSLFASYFPARLHRTEELPPTRKYIFGYHPHGIISHGAFAAFSTEALGFSQLFPGIKNSLLTLDSNFRIPIYREYALAMGLASVSRESCENILSKGGPNKEGMGRAITIVVGGARESLDAQPYSLRLVLKRRKGFVKLAIRTGADLVPVLAFGENDLYDQFLPDTHPKIHKVQLMVKKILGFTIPLFHARGVFNYDVGLMPYRRPLNIVVGHPIKVVQSATPQQEQIDRVHEEYVTELERLWDQWKDKFAPNRKEELQILE